ncbi:MAG: bifunctional UDP-2,4-diacetamido-2,4,6-trideoxy-beta-L-altropyranose hydrolase/GNAT family N-acetyltransferase, partial [Ignavibacteria bacterium]|nr:bifunctional UDP-2,4-diacetamido-2,4,6-trideoxy-beta-L-altropyranose hydrolase/GNAT family N-acetyltransferase [Ignavibacteria bacterium]
FTNIDQINEAKDKNTILHYAPDASMMLQLMLEADAAISAAGQTIYELARIGVPTIAIAVVDNQLNSMAGWFKEDFLIDNINYLNPNLEHKILLSFSNLQKRPVRERLSKLGRQKVDGGGAKRVVQALIDQIAAPFGFYLRRASEKDASLILNLSNDRVVRANSINQNPISWNEHIVWYNDKIRDINTLFLLAFNRNDGFIGQVRFDINDTSASINISIDKEFRGKGFSKSLIFTTSFKLLKEYPEVSTIKAYIRPQNTPSIKAFSKAGYVQAPDELINNEKFLVYIMARQ